MNKPRPLHQAEESPDGRYVRFDEKLGNGAYKEVFLAYDTETGKEVAWNTVNLARLPPTEKKRIRMETEILKELDHPHIINFFNVWENPARDQICFTTEIVTSGTLKEYVARVRNVKLKVIKKWCRQILTALDYLHCHAPPIIHRDLKCDNIFINGGTGEIRIGDFGLSAARHTTHVESVLGTPEFMAPELYDEHYSESVDIYSFGMCILEMTTKEYPYEECSNAAQIWKKVSLGQKPEVLGRIRNSEVKAFIEMCLAPAQERLSAREMLKHPFLKFKRSDPSRDNITVAVELRASPTHRQGKDEQKEQLAKLGAGAAGAGQKETQIRDLYNPSQTSQTLNNNNPGGGGGGRPHQHQANNSLDAGDNLISPASGRPYYPSPSPTPTHHHPQHNVNTATTPTYAQTVEQQQQHHQSSAHHQHQQNDGGYTHHNDSNTSSQTPPARFLRQGSLPNLVSTSTGLTHSQSVNTISSLQQPQPRHSHHLATPNNNPGGGGKMGGGMNASPDLIHVSSVVVEVESTHSHYANIALHIHFEAGTRRKKQIRFVFDFYRDTSDSIAGEMVRALKLPDQDRTARLIASNMELKIDPLRMDYYQHHGAATTNNAELSSSHAHPITSDSPSPSTSPSAKTKTLHGGGKAPSAAGGEHPPVHPHAGAAKPGVQSPHYSTLPSPVSHAHAAGGAPTGAAAGAGAGKHLPHHHNTMPTPNAAGHHPTPKLSSAQPTNIGGPRPATAGGTGAAKPPHPLTPHGTAAQGAGGKSQQPGKAVSPIQGGGGQMQYAEHAKTLGNRRHSHDPHNPHNLSQNDPMAVQPMVRTTSIPQNLGSSNTGSLHGHGGGTPPMGNSGLRRSSSTSSLAFMVTPDEAATKAHHDRWYEEFRGYSIAMLKEKIKERWRERQQAGEVGQGEAIELNGILEKSDLIESLIRLTPRAQQQQQQQQVRGYSPPSPRDTRFDHEPNPPSDASNSQASTPRIAYDQSGTATPAELRSRAQSIDAGQESALLGSYAQAAASGRHSLRTSDHPPSTSNNSSPSQSPLPSPVARSVQGGKNALEGEGEYHPSSHRISNEHYKDRDHQHQQQQQHGVPGPSQLARSTSSPHQAPVHLADLPDLGRSGKKGIGGQQQGGHRENINHGSMHGHLDTAPAASARNFTFPTHVQQHGNAAGGSSAGTASGQTSPASTSSQQSYHSSVGGSQLDLEELANYHGPQPTFPSSLHVDVNPLSPNPSAPPSAESAISPSMHARVFPHGQGGAPHLAAPGGAAASGIVHMTHLHPGNTPASPTIPEEEGDASAEAEDAFGATEMDARNKRQGGNPPLGSHHRTGSQQYSASTDDLSRLANGDGSSSAQRGSLTPSASPTSNSRPYPSHGGVGQVGGTLAHMRVSSASDAAPPSSMSGAYTTPAALTRQHLAAGSQHQRANSVFVASQSAQSSPHEEESEEKKKARLELAEKNRLQKKNDAAKAAKMCEDKILSGFSFH